MNFIKALAVLLGTIIGVGIFGLPYVALKAGFSVMLFYLVVMAILVTLMHCVYGEICIKTKGIHRLPGYVEEYLGKNWRNFIFGVIVIGLIGSSIAYLIIGGEFLYYLFSPIFGGSIFIYSFIFFLPAAFLVFKGIKMVASIELLLSALLLIIIFVLSWVAFPHINTQNLTGISWDSFFLPYGVVLFSLSGSVIIPELKEMVGGKNNLKKVIISGVFISALIYLIFTFVVLGSSGADTSKDAISGLAASLGPNVIKLGFVFGVITCFTSFLTLALTFKKTLWHDFKLDKNISWVIACFLPFLLFSFGAKRFIGVIGFTGAVSLGLESFVLIILYKKFLKKKMGEKINLLYYLLATIFIIGAVFEIYEVLN
jgi:amino acid permease